MNHLQTNKKVITFHLYMHNIYQDIGSPHIILSWIPIIKRGKYTCSQNAKMGSV